MAEESNQERRESIPPPPSPSSTDDPSSSTPSSTSQPQPVGEGNNGGEIEDVHLHIRNPRRHRRSSRISYRVNIAISEAASSEMRDDVWSCLVVLVMFWFFASMTLILGFYGSVDLKLGPNGSRLIQTNPFFVQSIQLEELDESKPGPVLYGFHKPPPLEYEYSWSETHDVPIPVNYHKEWIHFLNEGSTVNISYEVKSSLPVSLVIAKGKESLVEWIEDPSYPNTTLSWNIISGSGTVNQEFPTSSSYYIAVGNLNSEDVKVELNFSIKALLYNTSQAYHQCFLGDRPCSLNLFLFEENAAVITSPGYDKGIPYNNWHIKLSYGPRWITYFVGSGVMTVLVLLAFKFYSLSQCCNGQRSTESQEGQMETERVRLLSHKDDDDSSWGSSYDSVSHDEEDLEENLTGTTVEGKPLGEGENNSSPSGLCVICFDASRNCFFLPCGHCAACFSCGSRISEEDGSCPICRRKIKKVRKIFAV